MNTTKDPWVNTILSLCIDKYIASRKNNEEMEDSITIENIVSSMVNNCLICGDFGQVLGMAVDCRRMDWLNECINKFDDPSVLTSRTVKHAVHWVDDKKFRDLLLTTIEAH